LGGQSTTRAWHRSYSEIGAVGEDAYRDEVRRDALPCLFEE
jgi:hypothetical protein